MNRLKSLIKKSLQDLKSGFKSKKLFQAYFSDFVFFAAFISVYYYFFTKVMVHIEAVVSLAQTSTEGIMEATTDEQISFLVARNAEFAAHYTEILNYILMFFTVMAALWVLLQGLSWLLTFRALSKKPSLKDFYSKFALLSALWALAFALIVILSMKASYTTTMGAIPLIGSTASSIITAAFFMLLFCAAYTSYALIPHHTIKQILPAVFRKISKQWKIFIPSYILLSLLFAAEYLLFLKSMRFGYGPAFALLLILIFPTIIFSRIYAVMLSEIKE